MLLLKLFKHSSIIQQPVVHPYTMLSYLHRLFKTATKMYALVVELLFVFIDCCRSRENFVVSSLVLQLGCHTQDVDKDKKLAI